jgi:multidrug resistance efflux pump
MDLITPIAGNIVAAARATRHAREAAVALARVEPLLDPTIAPADAHPAVRAAFHDAVTHLEHALQHAGGRPGHRQVEAALEEAHEALAWLERPGIQPPQLGIMAEHAWRGGELLREAIGMLAAAPDAWTMRI